MSQWYGVLDFKRPELETELMRDTHPELRQLLFDLADWCKRIGIAKPVVTGLSRTEKENRAAGGAPKSLHLFHCAADLRTFHWNEETQVPQVMTWMHGEVAMRGGAVRWELLLHSIRTGLHLHVARKDPNWRNTPPPKEVA